MDPVTDLSTPVPTPGPGDHLRLVEDPRPQDAQGDVSAQQSPAGWVMPPNMISPWDPMRRDQRPCEILPTAERDRRWMIVGALSLVIIAGTVGLLALVS